VAFILAAGLVPLGAWGVASEGALRGLLDISLAPLEQVMDEADAALSGKGGPQEAAKVRERLSGARLALAELELARRSLARLEPRLFWAALALTAAVFGAMAVAVSRAFTRPIDQLTAGMAAVARGELGHVIPAERGPPRDELSYLVDRFNKMAAELLAQRERLRTTEQLAAWRDVARALAHELKNPLTAMKMSLARLTRASPSPSPDADRQREPLALLDEEVSVLMRMTQAFSEFARLPAAAPPCWTWRRWRARWRRCTARCRWMRRRRRARWRTRTSCGARWATWRRTRWRRRPAPRCAWRCGRRRRRWWCG